MRKKTLMSVPSTLHFSVMPIWVFLSSSPKVLSRVEDSSAVAVSVLVPSLRCTLTVGASPELYDSSSKTCTEETCESWRRCLAAALAALLSSNELGSRPGLKKVRDYMRSTRRPPATQVRQISTHFYLSSRFSLVGRLEFSIKAKTR